MGKIFPAEEQQGSDMFRGRQMVGWEKRRSGEGHRRLTFAMFKTIART